MKKLILFITIFSIGGICFAQYVSNTVVQNQILKDQAIINSCKQQINTAWQDINAIENDNSATAITANTPAIAAIQAAQSAKVATPAQPVGAKTAEPAVNSTGD